VLAVLAGVDGRSAATRSMGIKGAGYCDRVPRPSGGITRERVTTPPDRSRKTGGVKCLATLPGRCSMASTRTRHIRDTSEPPAEGSGLIIFAVALLIILGVFNLIYGIAAIARSHVFIANAHFVFGDLRAWGWVALIVGVLQVLAALGVMAGNQLARWFAVAVVALNAIAQMLSIPAYPFWSLTILAADVVALWALCIYGSRENLAD
jgi:hypothetical protein